MSRKEHIELTLRLLARIREASDPCGALEELLLCFAKLLVELPTADVQDLRGMFVVRLAAAKLDGEELLTLIDGHLAYRELVPTLS